MQAKPAFCFGVFAVVKQKSTLIFTYCLHDIPIWSMSWCDRLYYQKGKKLIVRTCYYLSFILKYKNSNSHCNNVTSGGRFCKLIFNSYQKFKAWRSVILCAWPMPQTNCLPYPRNDSYSSCVTLWSFNKYEKNQSVTAWFMWISIEKAQDPLFLVTCTLWPST